MANKSLKTKRLLILRQQQDSEILSNSIKKLQGNSIVWPALVLTKTPSPTKTQREAVEIADIYIFTSKAAVSFGWQWLNPKQTKTIIAIGKGTATQLKERGIDNVELPKVESSEGLLQMDRLQNVKDKKIILFKGEAGRDLLKKTLETNGASVTTLTLYKREMATMNNKTAEKIKDFSPNCVHITSETVADSLDKADQKFKLLNKDKIIALVVSKRIAKTVSNMGFLKTINLNSMRNEKIIEMLQKLPII